MSRSVIAAAAVGLVVLAGCGGPTEPSAPPTSEDALTTATPEPDVVEETTEAAPTTEAPEETAGGPPEMPNEAKERSEAGAEAFVQHYVSAFNVAYAEGDPTYLDSLAGEDCTSCTALRGLVSEPSTIDQYLTLEDVSGLLLGDAAQVEAGLLQAQTDTNPEQAGTAVFDLIHDGDTWKIEEITVRADD